MKTKKILSRIYVNNLSETLEFYEKLFNKKCEMRFIYKDAALELAQIDNLLIIAGSDMAIKPFKDTALTILVDSVAEYKSFLIEQGVTIIRIFKGILPVSILLLNTKIPQ